MTDAAVVRKAMLANLRRVVKLCACDWPITTYRNGHGHHPDCPAADTARPAGLNLAERFAAEGRSYVEWVNGEVVFRPSTPSGNDA